MTSRHATRIAAAKAANFFAARVHNIQTLATGVKRIDLTVQPPTANNPTPFAFLPGQWVDYYIESIDQVTGYSMISSPLDLPHLSLVVQYSSLNAAAVHVHENTHVHDLVWLRNGGQVTWDAASPTEKNHALMLAGGIGVTPYASMLRHLQKSKRTMAMATEDNTSKVASVSVRRCALLHSSTNNVLANDLEAMSKELPEHIRYQHSLTDGSGLGRINKKDIDSALAFLKRNEEEEEECGTVTMLCGTAPFVSDMTFVLTHDFDFQEEDILVEKWW